MKKLELTDEELEILYDNLCWAIQDEEDKEGFKRLATKYEKMLNKFFERSPKSQKQ